MSDQATEQSVEDRMMGFLDGEEALPDEPEDEEVEAEESESEEESEDTPEEPQKITLKRGEEEVEVDLEEAKNLAQMGYDYTKKTQEVAEQRKQVEIYAHAIKAQEQNLQKQAEMQSAFIKEIATVVSIKDQLTQYEALDWNALSDNDPVQAQKLYFQYQGLQTKYQQANQDIQQKESQLTQHREQQNSLKLEQAKADLLKVIPDWNAEKAGALRAAGKEYGYSDDELSTIVDPRAIKVLADAAAYRKLQAQKGNVTNKVIGKPPVIKPGANDGKRAARADTEKDRVALRKSGDGNLAAKLIERML